MLLALFTALLLSLSARAAEPNLELVHHPGTNASATPVLLTPGVCHNAGHFTQLQNDLEADSYALSLRGHGQSHLHQTPLWRIGVQQYLQDIDRAIDQIGEPVILVGHSMGGFIVQHYAERHPDKVKGLILLAAPPPRGAWGTTLRLLRNDPKAFWDINLSLNVGKFVSTHQRCHDNLFHTGIPMDETADYCATMEDESWMMFVHMLLNQPRRSQIRRDNIPVMVISGELDNVFSAKEVFRLARSYHVPHHLLDNMSHTLMAEEGHQNVTEAINRFAAGL